MSLESFICGATRICLLMVLAWNAALFGQGIRTGFVRPDGMPLLMRLLVLVATVAAGTDFWVIAATPQVPLTRVIPSVLLLGASQKIFRCATRATLARRLSLAFSAD